ncbi:biotin--[acetyl-CoA-carboxylase] ligase [Janibacter alittae]|uniref:Biotin--[acetyl-CoA-carboxylase] ligase n=1 Tax=Janibacter alittae TaxID=3115209 RepID=A0ABZ2MEZ8_9MICO
MPTTMDVQRLTTLLPPAEGWGEVVHLSRVGSTNTAAATRGVLWSPVVTEHQTAGRGRLGRPWQDTPGASLAMSVLVPPVDPPGWLPLATGLAVRSALVSEGVDAHLKWPNDVLLPGDEDRKVCGILCQSQPDGRVVVGIGINVGHDRGDLPVGTATSLRLVGAHVDRTTVAATVLRHLRRQHTALTEGGDRAEEVRAAYAAACATLGRRVVLHRPDGTREEVETTGLDREGRLRVTGAHGSDTVAAGDVQHIRLPGASSS